MRLLALLHSSPALSVPDACNCPIVYVESFVEVVKLRKAARAQVVQNESEAMLAAAEVAAGIKKVLNGEVVSRIAKVPNVAAVDRNSWAHSLAVEAVCGYCSLVVIREVQNLDPLCKQAPSMAVRPAEQCTQN